VRMKSEHMIVTLILIGIVASHSQGYLLFSSVRSPSAGPSAVDFEAKEALTGNLIHTIRINNSASGRITGANLLLPLIGNVTARHYVLLTNISSLLGTPEIIKDNSGNAYAVWKNLAVERGQSITVEVDYRLLSFTATYQLNSSLVGDYDRNSQLYNEYIQPEEFIQSNDSEIILKAGEIANEQNTTLKKVSRIYQFVISHMHYEAQDYERGALWALENGTGDCSEYSYLFVALCRASGIPARIQTGFAFHHDIETTEDGHMWAEYYLENYGWIPVDATWRQLNAIDKRHFTQIRGKPDDMPYSNFFFNYTSGPSEDELEESHMVTLEPLPVNALNDTALEAIARSVRKIAQVRPIVSLAETTTSLILHSDTEEMKQMFHESQQQLQDAILDWQEHPQEAQTEATTATQTADNALKKAWTAIAYTLSIVILVMVSTMLIMIVLSKRHKRIT